MSSILPFPTDSDASSGDGGVIEGLHWVRAIGAVAVVTLHSTLPYASRPMPGLVWPVSHPGSVAVDAVCWGIELFVMPLFLILAGFLAMRTMRHRGPGALWRSRWPRLIWPLVGAIVFVLPIELYVWVDGWVIADVVPVRKLQSLKFDGGVDQHLWGTSHLWFLVYLLTYVGLFSVGGRLVRRWRTKFRVPLWGGMVAIVLAAAAVVAARPAVVWGFQHAWYPVPSKWIYSGLCFVLGVVVAAADPNWRLLTSRRWLLTGAAIASAMPAWWLGMRYLDRGVVQPMTGIETRLMRTDVAESVALGSVTAIAAIGLSMTIVVWAMRAAGPVPVVVKRLSAASMWIYLVHHPLVGLVQIDVRAMWPQGGAFAASMVTLSVTMTICWASYRGIVEDRAWAVRWRLVARANNRSTEPMETGSQNGVRRHQKVRPAA